MHYHYKHKEMVHSVPTLLLMLMMFEEKKIYTVIMLWNSF